MSPENQSNQANYPGVLPDTAALENHADRLIDDLFADIDNILEGGTKLPNQLRQPDYPALKSGSIPQVTLPPGTSTGTENLGLPPLGYSQTNFPQDRLGAASYQAPTLIPNLTPETPPHNSNFDEVTQPQIEPPEAPLNEEKSSDFAEDNSRIPPPSVPISSSNLLDRWLFWGIWATFASLTALFFLWLVSQYRINVLRTANTTNSQTAPITKDEKDFIDYMQKSLQAIDQKATITPPQPTSQTFPPTSNLPVLSPGVPSITPERSIAIPVPSPTSNP